MTPFEKVCIPPKLTQVTVTARLAPRTAMEHGAFCPYSRATRGNINVAIAVATNVAASRPIN